MKILCPHTVTFSQASATQISKFTNQNHSYKIYGYHKIVDNKHIMISDENIKKNNNIFNVNASMHKHDKKSTHNKKKKRSENSAEKQRSEILVKNLHS